MKYLLTLLISAYSALAAPSVSLAWDPNDELDLAGYIMYYGPSSGHYTNQTDVGNTTNHTVTNLVYEATYYFAVTAYNTTGLESDFSNEVNAYFDSPQETNTIVAVTLDISDAVTGQWTNVWSGMITNPVSQQFYRIIARREQ